MIARIRQLLTWQQLSPTQFADIIGVGRPVISHILSERNKPSLEVVQRIIAAFPAISLPWLLSGTGDMLATNSEQARASSAPNPEPAVSIVATTSPAAPAVTLQHTIDAEGAEKPKLPSDTAAPSATKLSTPMVVPRAAPPAARFVAGRQPAIAAATSQAEISTGPSVSAIPISQSPELISPSIVPPLSPAPTVEVTPAPTSVPASASIAARVTGDEASLAALLAEPEKAIRRIVIFYRDGSFADYVPEG